MIMDLHSHYFPVELAHRLPNNPVELAKQADGSYRMTVAGHSQSLPTTLFDLDIQRELSRRQGLDARTLLVPPFTALYELPAREGIRWAQALNDGIAEAASRYPEELIGFATVPLQDVAASVAELERAAGQLKLRGVEILTSINGVGLDTPDLDSFWEAVEHLALPILVHPHYVSGANRMSGYHLRNLIGNPAETALAGARLLFGGVLERYPNLRIILSHGGGALPHLIGRLGQGFKARAEARERARDPIANIGKLYYDTIVFDPVVLRHVVEIVGASQLVLGTDYPFDMSEEDPVAFVKGAGLRDSEAEAILNAGERLLGKRSTSG